MASEMVQQVLDAEAAAQEMIQAAHDGAQKIIDEGERQAVQLQQETLDKAHAQHKWILEQAREGGQEAALARGDQTNIALVDLEDAARLNRQEAVEAAIAILAGK